MTDTERLDAIGGYGLQLACDQHYGNGKFREVWHCRYGMGKDDVTTGKSIREVIDFAINVHRRMAN